MLTKRGEKVRTEFEKDLKNELEDLLEEVEQDSENFKPYGRRGKQSYF